MSKLSGNHLCLFLLLATTVSSISVGCSKQIAEVQYYRLLSKGDKLLSENKVEEAISYYDKAIALNPENSDAYLSLGNLYKSHLGDFDKAIRLYSKGLEKAPMDDSLNNNLMYAYFSGGRVKEGIKQYEKIFELDVEISYGITFPRDVISEIMRPKSEADQISFCKKYINLNPDDYLLREYLARIYLSTKKYEQATEHLEYLIQIDKGDIPRYLYYLGMCHQNLGNPSLANDYFAQSKGKGAWIPDSILDRYQWPKVSTKIIPTPAIHNLYK